MSLAKLSYSAPRAASGRDAFFNTLFVVAPIVLLSSGRVAPFVLLAIGLALVIDAGIRGTLPGAMPKLDIVTLCVAAFILYAGLSAFWAAEAYRPLSRSALAAATALGALLSANLLRQEQNVSPMIRGLLAGYVFGLAYCLIELASDEQIKIWLFNALKFKPATFHNDPIYTWTGTKLVAIDDVILNRSITALSLLFWPIGMIVLYVLRHPHRRAAAFALAVAVLVTAMLSAHTTSKVAIIGGFIFFGLTHLSRRLTHLLLCAAWFISCVAVVPIAQLGYKVDLQNAPWLKQSGQVRIVIWNTTAEQAMKAPFFGLGADMTHDIGPVLEKTLPPDKFEKQLSIHAHDVFLQAWFELGLVGALLLAAMGLAILSQMRKLAMPVAPFAYAIFGSIWIYCTASFGMWQAWYMGVFALVVVLMALAQRGMELAGPDGRAAAS